MNKRGQFFLVAGLIIAALLLSLAAVNNSARVSKEDTKTQSIFDSLSYEGARVIDSGVYQSKDQTFINSRLADLAGNYSSSSPDSDFFVIYGDAGNLSLFNYNSCRSVGEIGFDYINSEQCVSQTIKEPCKSERNCKSSNGKITLTIGGIGYSFNLQQGQNFYVVLKRDNLGETYVATSENGP